MYRGLLKAKMITPNDIPLLERKLAEKDSYKRLNMHFTQKRGHRWANRLQAFAAWLWQNREAILQILGLVIMFAEDGTPTLREEKELDPETAKQAKYNLGRRAPTKTPDGEKVEDFTEPSDEVPTLVTNESVVPKEDAEKALDELVKINEEAGFYDIGLSADESLHEESDDDEVQSGETSGEATDRLKSDDV